MTDCFNATLKMMTRVRETYDDFIFETVQPFCERVTKLTISKKMLTDALIWYEKENSLLESLLADNARLLAERDAAVADMKEFHENTGDGCMYCAHLPCYPKHDRCIGWEWRGVREVAKK